MAIATNYYTYEDIVNEDDGSVERKAVVRCMHCLDTVISINGKTNSSYNERRIFLLNGDKPTYIQAMVCNECKNKALNVTNIINQIQASARTTLRENKVIDSEIGKVINKHYKLTEIKDTALLKKCEKFLSKQEKAVRR